MRLPQRHQVEFRSASLDQLLPPDHEARLVWAFVDQLDLSALLRQIRAVAHHPGQPANDPRLLLAVWLYATTQGVGSAREVARLCEAHIAYQWLCGGVPLCSKSLSDFRIAHTTRLNDLLTQSLAAMMHEGLVEIQRVAQDGLRVRASAGASSFRRKPTLRRCLEEARAQVAALENQVDEDQGAASRRQQAARERSARERQQRLEKALREREQLAQRREQQQQEKGKAYDPDELRVSTTDPEARRMKMPDGGTRPGYNVQLATTTAGGFIVGVHVTNSGSDGGQLQPMAEQVEKRTGQKPQAMLVDGGFTTLSDIEHVEQDGIPVYGPIKAEAKKKAQGIDPHQPRKKDGPGVSAWRARMGTEEAKGIYRLRAQTAEWANAGVRNRGLYQVRVRGLHKVLAVVLWHALAHNLLRAVAVRQAKTAEGTA
ncbi:MAG: IS1182 family transposase [Planctomycetes bacterium]|nr:IS1182 family transposase [Planctomycetota bacterium]